MLVVEDAETFTVMVPETVAPSAGEVIVHVTPIVSKMRQEFIFYRKLFYFYRNAMTSAIITIITPKTHL